MTHNSHDTDAELIRITVADAEWAIAKFVKPNTMRAMIERMRKRSDENNADTTPVDAVVACRVVCEQCGWQGNTNTILTAVNPFDDKDDIQGCPRCKSVDPFRPTCDEPGCWESVTCGMPTDRGYRNTCSRHRSA